jgi:hypothetical protein
MLTVNRQKNWIPRLARITTIIAWVLANGLDVFSLFLLFQLGKQPAFAGTMARHHPFEYILIYAGLRTLVTLAACFGVPVVEKHFAPKSQVFWNALTAGALITAIAAWLRIYQ